MNVVASTTVDKGGKYQVVMMLDSEPGRGVRAIRINRSTGEAHSLVSAGGFSVKWRKFKNDPGQPDGGTFELITVADVPERGLRSMLVNVSSGTCWWLETDSTGHQFWTPVAPDS